MSLAERAEEENDSGISDADSTADDKYLASINKSREWCCWTLPACMEPSSGHSTSRFAIITDTIFIYLRKTREREKEVKGTYTICVEKFYPLISDERKKEHLLDLCPT